MSTSAERLLHPLRDQLIGLARLGDAAKDGCARRSPPPQLRCKRQFDDLARMHARSVDRAAEQLLELNQAMALIEIQAAEHLVLEIAQPGAAGIRGSPAGSRATGRRATICDSCRREISAAACSSA